MIDSLENRLLMTLIIEPWIGYVTDTAQYRFHDHVLYVRGYHLDEVFHATIQNNRLVITDQHKKTTFIYTTGESTILPAIDGYTQNASQAPLLQEVDKIVFDAAGGNDRIDLSNLSIPCEVYGGDGNDSIIGSSANDTLVGNNGNDLISDGAGNDVLAGSAGNDSLRSGAGRDSLFGQGGHDLLVSKSRKDWLDGGSAYDKCNLLYPADKLVNMEGFVEQSKFIFSESNGSYGNRLTLTQTGGRFTIEAVIVLPSPAWDVDWDLVKTSRNHFEIQSQRYQLGPGWGAAQVVMPRRVTFQLPAIDTSQPVNISLVATNSSRTVTLIEQSFTINKTFTSETFSNGSYASNPE